MIPLSHASEIPFELQRARPCLGTVVKIRLQTHSYSEANAQAVINDAFDEIARLERMFSFHAADSELALFNETLASAKDFSASVFSHEFWQLIQTALQLREFSQAAFEPFVTEYKLDLGGIAKGYIVDRCRDLIEYNLPQASGVINAGGDITFWGTAERKIDLKVGAPRSPQIVSLKALRRSAATSSLAAREINSLSSTRYRGSLRSHVPDDFTVVAMADRCDYADALTKIVMYGAKADISDCCRKLNAVALVFAGNAQLSEVFGEP